MLRENEKENLFFCYYSVPPDVYSPKLKSYHSIGDSITFECLIDSNPEADIRWIHRFSDDINQEVDLSRQFNQGFYNNKRRDGPIWSITQEKMNSTRWKTNLFIKVLKRTAIVSFIYFLFVFSIFHDVFSIQHLSVELRIVTVKANEQSQFFPIIIIIIIMHRKNIVIQQHQQHSHHPIYLNNIISTNINQQQRHVCLDRFSL